MSGSLSPDLGKLDQLKFLYVFFLMTFFVLFAMLKCDAAADGIMMYHVVELCMTTIFMGQFLQNWEIAHSCRQCKHYQWFSYD